MQTGANHEKDAQGGDVRRILKQVFGFDRFRPNQLEIVTAIMQKKDAFTVMPTGGGKSLCYQLPAHIMGGTCVVVSPLISLMKDQVDAAQTIGLRAAFLNSSLSGAQQTQVSGRLGRNELDLIYISPERFAIDSFLRLLRRVNLSFFAIDEAHCISEWGHDFRPDYLNLSQIIKVFPDVHVAAFTATATRRVQADIIDRLQLRNPHVVRSSFNRPNLYYRVVPKENPAAQIADFVRGHAGEAGIIYRTTRRSVDATAADLAQQGIRALPYHAGLSDQERRENQEAFNRDEVDVIVATIAFGMGIDKSNVRYVLHGDLPKNIEGYYQETGRAGRDGEPAECLLLFGRGDIPKIRYFIDRIPEENERQHALNCLNEMVNYAAVHVCRRRKLLAYFGENLAEDQCGTCDICAGEAERVEATRDAQMLMSAIVRTGERFGVNHVVDVVTGAQTERIRKTGHDQIKTYGIGRDRDKRYWRTVIDNLLGQSLIEQTDERYPVLRLLPAAAPVLYEGQPFYMLRQNETRAKKPRRAAEFEYNQTLFEQLRTVRKALADDQGVPPYVVFSDRTLHEIACVMPVTQERMLDVSGVGQLKYERYGEAFRAVVEQFRQTHPEITPGSMPVVSAAQSRNSASMPPKKGTHTQSWELVQQGMRIDEVAKKRGLTVGTIIGHIEKGVACGHLFDFDVDDYVKPEKRLLLEQLFGEHDPKRLGPVVAAANGAVSYEEARLVRLWLNPTFYA
jgi:ATP-dependent DNA helicase RecQ